MIIYSVNFWNSQTLRILEGSEVHNYPSRIRYKKLRNFLVVILTNQRQLERIMSRFNLHKMLLVHFLFELYRLQERYYFHNLKYYRLNQTKCNWTIRTFYFLKFILSEQVAKLMPYSIPFIHYKLLFYYPNENIYFTWNLVFNCKNFP